LAKTDVLRNTPLLMLATNQKKKLELRKLHSIKSTLRANDLHSVCEEARCPNRSECFSRGTATFLAMGDVCTRRCSFCSIATGLPLPLDPEEPAKLAQAALDMRLRHIVITSVNRDELPDGGSAHLAKILSAVRNSIPGSTTEILTPDFKGDLDAVDQVLAGLPDVFNHNLETVPSLYKKVRPGATLERSLSVLRHAKSKGFLTKTGLMLGLGEDLSELKEIFTEIRKVGTDILTLGQYFQPTKTQLKVVRYLPEEEYAEIASLAREKGIPFVYSGTYVRSSYNADEVFEKIQNSQQRQAKRNN
jgi:lipoic acid synthetase